MEPSIELFRLIEKQSMIKYQTIQFWNNLKKDIRINRTTTGTQLISSSANGESVEHPLRRRRVIERPNNKNDDIRPVPTRVGSD